MQVSAVRSRKTFTAAKAAFDFTHKKLGHCGSMKRLIRFKKEGKLVASQLPPKYLREFRKPCAICLAMKKRMPRRPKALDPQDRAALTPWEVVYSDTSATLVDLMTNPSRSDPSMTKFEHLYHVVPNLDLLPPVGCFCVRIQEKKDRIDQKLDPLNLQGTFLGFATIRGCYGSVILTDKGTLVSARHNVAYDEELMPRHDLSATNPRLRALQWLIGRGPDHATSSLPFKASDRTPLQSDIEQAPTEDNSANPILPDASHQLDDNLIKISLTLISSNSSSRSFTRTQWRLFDQIQRSISSRNRMNPRRFPPTNRN